jgi:hypothetical protein
MDDSNPDTSRPGGPLRCAATAWRDATPIRRWQVALVIVGIGFLVLGGLVMLTDVPPRRYLGVVIWLAGAIVVHDLVIAPLVIAVGLLMRRAGRRLSFAVVAIIQVGVVVSAIVSLIVVPEAVKRTIGVANPTVLPLDYWANLAIFLGVVAVMVTIASIVYSRVVVRRQKLRPPTSQA